MDLIGWTSKKAGLFVVPGASLSKMCYYLSLHICDHYYNKVDIMGSVVALVNLIFSLVANACLSFWHLLYRWYVKLHASILQCIDANGILVWIYIFANTITMWHDTFPAWSFVSVGMDFGWFNNILWGRISQNKSCTRTWKGALEGLFVDIFQVKSHG